MAKVYDVIATVGEYTNKQGETKKRYLNIGSVIESDKGMSINIESIPVGWTGWAGLYVPKEKEHIAPAKPQSKGAFDDFQDSPF